MPRIEEVIENFKQLTKKECYEIKYAEDEADVLDSKIGGVPYFPIGTEYPKDKNGNPLAFFVQINFEGIQLEGYPNHGILELFVDCEMGWPSEYKVLYFEDTTLEQQENLPEVKLCCVEMPSKITLEKTVTYMPITDYRFDEIIAKSYNEVCGTNIKALWDLEDDEIDGIGEMIYGEIAPALLGGYADFTQSDPRGKSSNMDECVIKIDSNLGSDKIMIGDAGIAWLVGSIEDIKSRNFSELTFDWDCC